MHQLVLHYLQEKKDRQRFIQKKDPLVVWIDEVLVSDVVKSMSRDVVKSCMGELINEYFLKSRFESVLYRDLRPLIHEVSSQAIREVAVENIVDSV